MWLLSVEPTPPKKAKKGKHKRKQWTVYELVIACPEW